MRPKILIVDDEVELVEVLNDVFTFHDFEVLTAGDGIEALQVLETATPDIILSDFRMPNCDGKAFFETLKTIPTKAAIPFIFLSATPEPLISLNANAVLTKPFQLDELLTEVIKALKYSN